MAVTMEPIDKERFTIHIEENTIFFKGSLDTHDSGDFLEEIVKDIHKKIIAEGLKEFRIDLTSLKFINSPAISVFAEWITIIEEEEEQNKYTLVFVCNIKEHMWQEATISSLEFINQDYVRKEVIV